MRPFSDLRLESRNLLCNLESANAAQHGWHTLSPWSACNLMAPVCIAMFSMCVSRSPQHRPDAVSSQAAIPQKARGTTPVSQRPAADSRSRRTFDYMAGDSWWNTVSHLLPRFTHTELALTFPGIFLPSQMPSCVPKYVTITDLSSSQE